VVYDCIEVRPLNDVAFDSEEFMESDVDDDNRDDLGERMEDLEMSVD
jgi:hypothetical protein